MKSTKKANQVKSYILGFFFSCFIISVFSMPLAAQKVTLDNQGKTVYISPPLKGEKDIYIEILHVPVNKMENYQIRYRYLDIVKNPFLLPENDKKTEKVTEKQQAGVYSRLTFKIPKIKKKFLVYNLWVLTNTVLDPSEIDLLDKEVAKLKKCMEKINNDIKQIPEYKKLLKKNEKLVKEKKDKKNELDRLNVEIDKKKVFKDEEIAVYQKLAVENTIPQIQRIFKEIELLRNSQQVQELEKEIRKMETERNNNIARMNEIDEEHKNEHNYSEKKQQHKKKEDRYNKHSKKIYSVKKVGGIVICKNSKSVYYDTILKKDNNKINLKRLGDYPILTQDDYIYAVVINRVEGIHSSPFYLMVSSEKGNFVQPTPVRPTEQVGLQSGTAESQFIDQITAYRDEILTFGRTFPGDHILTVSISTYTKIITEDKETTGTNKLETKTVENKMVNLIDSVKYPQIRTLYRYNLNTGLIFSTLRNSEFKKVKYQNEESEIRYRTDEIKNSRSISPIIAFTIYTKKKDIHIPLTWKEMLTPNLTIALKLLNPNPTKNIYCGFSHEFPVRNMQLFYGVHYGEVDEKKLRNEVDENEDPNDPVTTKKHKWGFAIGLKFNIDFLSKIIH